MSIATIQLTQSVANNLSCAEQSAWPLSIVALGTNMPSEIFVYQLVPATDTIPGDRFQTVASVSQLDELPIASHPEKERDPKHGKHQIFEIPFYRSSCAEFVCRSADEAECLWTDIQAQTQRLVDNYNQWLNLQTTNIVVISPV